MNKISARKCCPLTVLPKAQPFGPGSSTRSGNAFRHMSCHVSALQLQPDATGYVPEMGRNAGPLPHLSESWFLEGGLFLACRPFVFLLCPHGPVHPSGIAAERERSFFLRHLRLLLRPPVLLGYGLIFMTTFKLHRLLKALCPN